MTSTHSKPRNDAESAAILRSVYKDDQYKLQLKNETNDLFQRLFGIRKWMRVREECDSLSEWTYYLVTTLAGLQTLGEEYVGIVQTDGKQMRVAKWWKRVMMTVLTSFGPLLINQMINRIEKILQDMSVTLWPVCLNENPLRNRLISVLPHVRHSLTVFHRLHLICFYFYGDFYEIPKRITNVRYVSLKSGQRFQSNRIYHLLGWLTLTQLLLSVLTTFYSSFISKSYAASLIEKQKTERLVGEEGDEMQSREDVKSRERCSLCLEKRESSTATPCGHLFCWQCIAEWLQTKTECPLCRESVTPSRLIFLNNF